MAELNIFKAPEPWGSDELLELFCEVCFKDGDKVRVCAYCTDCDEYICKLCRKYHTRFLKDHTILDGDNMPKDAERCPLHREIIKLYCETCEKLACDTCKANHTNSTSGKIPCKLTTLAELSKEIEQSQELRNFITKLDKSDSKSVKMKHNGPNPEYIANQAKQEVQKYKDKILAKAEQMNSEIDKRKQTDSNELLTITAKSNALISKMEEVSKKIKQRYANVRKQRTQMFIAMKHVQSEIESLNKEMDEITTEMDKLYYIFEPDTNIMNLIVEYQTFGTLITKSETEMGKVQMEKRKIAVHQYKIFEKDSEIKVTDFCVLPGQVLAVCDLKDNSVKLFSASQKSVIATCQTNTTPTAITYIGNRKFAVAQKSPKNETSSTITFILWSSTDTLFYNGKYFEVESKCLDITHVPDKHRLIVLLHNDTCDKSKVQILDMSGKILETFHAHLSDPTTELFSNFSWLALNKNQNILYATNLQHDELITIHLDKEEENEDRITKEFLLAPNGIACDNQGFIYASLHGHNKIMYYNPENGESQDVLTVKDNIFAPETLKYCDEDNLLYVDNCNNIDVFKIIEKECVWKETLEKVWKWQPISTSEFS